MKNLIFYKFHYFIIVLAQTEWGLQQYVTQFIQAHGH